MQTYGSVRVESTSCKYGCCLNPLAKSSYCENKRKDRDAYAKRARKRARMQGKEEANDI